MRDRLIKHEQKKAILDRDGWKCRICGHTPLHTFTEIDASHKTSLIMISLWMICKLADSRCWRRLIRVTKYEIHKDHEDGTPNVILEWISGHDMDVDHIIPCHIKEDHSPENLQTLCKDCHRLKSNFDYRYTVGTKYILSKYMFSGGLLYEQTRSQLPQSRKTSR